MGHAPEQGGADTVPPAAARGSITTGVLLEACLQAQINTSKGILKGQYGADKGADGGPVLEPCSCKGGILP